jgi:hypothetical protein
MLFSQLITQFLAEAGDGYALEIEEPLQPEVVQHRLAKNVLRNVRDV